MRHSPYSIPAIAAVLSLAPVLAPVFAQPAPASTSASAAASTGVATIAAPTIVNRTEYFADAQSLETVTLSGSGSVSLSDAHSLFGAQALRWEWKGGDVLEVTHPFFHHWQIDPDGVVYAPVFELNIYAEQPQPGKLTFEVGGASFTFGLDFRGWRAALVRYFGDMQGSASASGNGYRILAPASGQGVLWLDGMNPGSYTYEAIPQPDWQVPYIQDGLDEHRQTGARRSNLLTMQLNVDASVATAAEIAATEKIIAQLEAEIMAQPPRALAALDRDAKAVLAGMAMRSGRQLGLTPPRPPVARPRHVYSLMLDYARHYRQSGSAHAAQMYRKLLDYSRDQGWQEGSTLGSLHLTGYDGATERTQSSLLMRDVLRADGLLDTVARDMQWQMNSRECLILPTHEGNLDYMHTFMIPQLISFLVIDDANERVAWLKAWSHYVNAVVGSNTVDDKDGFKTDGAAFHHYGHYPLYAAGAYKYVAKLNELLAGTPFALSEEALAHVRNSLAVVSVNILEDGELPISLSGRHPFGTARLLASMPESMQSLNVQPLPQRVFLPVNNAAFATHGRPGWQAVMRGFSSYVWPAEIFAQSGNRYGVFNNHGTIEILDRKGLAASGYAHDGWDWRKLPGATTLLAPYAVLKDFAMRTYRSREPFTGALTLDGVNGQFATVLSNDFFELRARKSVFCFDDVIVSLGDGITGYRQNYDTVTTLFQNAIGSSASASDSVAAAASGATADTQASADTSDIAVKRAGDFAVLSDAVGNAYLVKGGDNVRVHSGVQHSFSQNKAQPTQGNFRTAWLDHGRRPADESYQYVILVGADEDAARRYLDSARIEVLEQSKRAHIVRDSVSGITAATLFEAGEVGHPLLRLVSKPCLVQWRQDASGVLDLALCDPDLQWDRQRSDEVRIELAGNWQVPQQPGVTFSQVRDGATSIIAQPHHGQPLILRGLREVSGAGIR